MRLQPTACLWQVRRGGVSGHEREREGMEVLEKMMEVENMSEVPQRELVWADKTLAVLVHARRVQSS